MVLDGCFGVQYRFIRFVNYNRDVYEVYTMSGK
jgi:hypothetical protein